MLNIKAIKKMTGPNLKGRLGQNTAEYALLIALVIAGIIAMQTYAQRSLQARVRDASQFMTTNPAGNGGVIGTTAQYEPYYQQQDYDVNRRSEETTMQGNGLEASASASNRERATGGRQTSTYDPAVGVQGGL